MKTQHVLSIVLIAILATVAGAYIVHRSHEHDNHEAGGHGHHEMEHSHEDEFERGPHGGRLLRDGDFATEVTIFEKGVPPEFRVYFYEHGKLVAPAEVELDIELSRLGDRTASFTFRPEREFLRSAEVVEEPHSFDVAVSAETGGIGHHWTYASHEGRVELDSAAVRAAKIEIDVAGPATIRTTLALNGRIRPNEDRMAHMIPRFPGVVKEARKRLGDRVEKGEVLAIVQSNESLESYKVLSEIAGTVIKKHVTPGEFVDRGEEVYVIADLSTVWVDLDVYRQDFPRLEAGQRVAIDAGEGVAPASGEISYISPFGAANTQTMLARVELPNPTGEWRPGLFVTAEVVVDEAEVPVAIRRSGVQKIRDWDVVFGFYYGEVFEILPLELGRGDNEWIEVISGIEAGRAYAAANSYVVKAELGKAGATHDH
jgi:cobalt-zinc-cadmium efflux system membrane fusion protein